MYPEKFARLYDGLMDDYDYDMWAEHYLKIAETLGVKKIATVCECGCGTGSMSVRWADMGLRVTGVDISPAMLDVAGDKAREAGLDIRFALQDMRVLELPRPVDAIFCPCDAVNYLTDGLQDFLSRAYDFIKPGGILAFDVSTPKKLVGMDKELFYEDRDDVTYFWKNDFKDGLVEMSLTFFARHPNGLYERFDENQVQRAFGLEQIIGEVEKAGFVGCRAFGEYGFGEASQSDMRWHIAAIRKC